MNILFHTLAYLVSVINADNALLNMLRSDDKSTDGVGTFEKIVVDLVHDDVNQDYTIPAFFGENQQGG